MVCGGQKRQERWNLTQLCEKEGVYIIIEAINKYHSELTILARKLLWCKFLLSKQIWSVL